MKTTSKQADAKLATLAKLTNAMQRNTSLATGGQPRHAGPVATYTPQPPAPRTSAPANTRTSGIRLKPNDHVKIRAVIQAGLALQETLTVADTIRLALEAYDPKRLNASDIARLRASDGRLSKAAARRGELTTVAQ